MSKERFCFRYPIRSDRGISINASAAGRIKACPSSYWLSRLNDMPWFKRNTDTKLSVAGTEVHAESEQLIAGCAWGAKSVTLFCDALDSTSVESDAGNIAHAVSRVIRAWHSGIRGMNPRKKLEFTVTVEPRFWMNLAIPVSGQADLVIWESVTREMLIFDYKSGANAKDAAPQLSCLSGLAVMGEAGLSEGVAIGGARHVRAVGIVKAINGNQYRVREDFTDRSAEASVWNPGVLADAVVSGVGTIAPGEHCGFCPAMHLCPVMQSTMKALPEIEGSIATTALTRELVDAVYLGADAAEATKQWFTQRLKSGYEVPGRRLTRPSPMYAVTNVSDAIKLLEERCAEMGDNLNDLRNRLAPRVPNEKLVLKELESILAEDDRAAELIVSVPGNAANIRAKE